MASAPENGRPKPLRRGRRPGAPPFQSISLITLCCGAINVSSMIPAPIRKPSINFSASAKPFILRCASLICASSSRACAASGSAFKKRVQLFFVFRSQLRVPGKIRFAVKADIIGGKVAVVQVLQKRHASTPIHLKSAVQSRKALR